MAKKAQKSWTHRVRGVKKPATILIYCAQSFPILGSKTATNKAISSGRLFLNGRKASTNDVLKNGDVLKLKGSGIQKARPFDAQLEVVYEDDWLIAINKPAGIAVNGNRNKTVENAVAGTAKPSRQADALPRPIAAHRIDLPTKGLVLLAKTKSSLIQMGKAFQQNQVKKEYRAVVHGKPKVEGQIDSLVEGKKAITNYQRLQVAPSKIFKHFSLLNLRPVTGRTHQLRIHLQRQGHLIVGDKLYAKEQKTILGKGLFLCACRLQFAHPHSGKSVDIQIQAPARFTRLLEREQQRFES